MCDPIKVQSMCTPASFTLKMTSLQWERLCVGVFTLLLLKVIHLTINMVKLNYISGGQSLSYMLILRLS